MLDWQDEFFTDRDMPGGPDGPHSSNIVNAYGDTVPDSRFRQLCQLVFTAHPVEIPPLLAKPSGPADYDLQGRHLPHAMKDWLAYEFYHSNHYKPPETLIKDIDLNGAVQSYRADFLPRLKEHVKPGTRNQLTFLVGDIGSGKSTLASHIVFKEGPALIQNSRILPLRLDFASKFEASLALDDHSERQVLAWIFARMLFAFTDLGFITEAQREEMGPKYKANWVDSDLLTCQHALAHLREALYQQSKLGLLLVFDNLDFLYHIYDRALFVNQAVTPKYAATNNQIDLQQSRDRAFQVIHYLLKTFARDGEDSLRHLGVNLLFVLRSDSLAHYNTTVRDLAAPDLLNATFRLPTPDLYDVMDAHMGLLSAACKAWRTPREGKLFDEAARTLAPLRPSSDAERPTPIQQMHQDLLALSRQGLRQFVTHLGKYFWLPISIREEGDEQVIVERFRTQYSPSIYAFLQKDRRLYSQFAAEFPNLYLVRAEYHRDAYRTLENLALPHRHTYWLKRLLLEYICQRQLAGKPVTPQRIYDVFCNPSDGEDSYEDHVVRLCLGSMSEVASSRLIDLSFSEQAPAHRVLGVRLSSRGWRLMGYLKDGRKRAPNVFADTFAYLQLIVDDYILLFPQCTIEWFQYRTGLDYGYLAAPPDVYKVKLREMIETKVGQVFLFLDVLRFALEEERRVFRGAFDRLARVGRVPTVDEISNRVDESMGGIQASLQRWDSDRGRDDRFEYKKLVIPRERYETLLREELRRGYGPRGTSNRAA
jgi:hypothetical protein